MVAACLAAVFLTGGAAIGAIAFDRISADSLRTNIVWLAADQRAGRMTPSEGLEASADYLAAQFRMAGLEPGGVEGTFFQTAAFTQTTPATQRPGDFRMTLVSGSRRTSVGGNSVSVRSLEALDFQAETIVRLPVGTGSVPMPVVEGRVVAGDETQDTDARLHALEALKPALILLVFAGPRPDAGPRPKEADVPVLMDTDPSIPPVIRIYSRTVAVLLASRNELRLTLHLAAPARHDVSLRNVVGMLTGSDPAVSDQFVILSAHYDHLGKRPPGPGNRIYHGANDNASGDASLIEIAKALAADPHPRRSVLFLALFGEEEDLLGSAFYVRHPLVPLALTIADINLEQLGRTDSSDGPEIGRFAFTGAAYSNLPQIVSPAAKTAGVTVYRKETSGDYFDRSDNYSFALAGVVAHTIVVGFEFADYHEVSDEAWKLDYRNLARVDRGIAAGVAAVANADEAPKWSDAKGARIYRDTAGGH